MGAMLAILAPGIAYTVQLIVDTPSRNVIQIQQGQTGCREPSPPPHQGGPWASDTILPVDTGAKRYVPPTQMMVSNNGRHALQDLSRWIVASVARRPLVCVAAQVRSMTDTTGVTLTSLRKGEATWQRSSRVKSDGFSPATSGDWQLKILSRFNIANFRPPTCPPAILRRGLRHLSP